MVLIYGDMLQCLSEKIYDLSAEIDEYSQKCDRGFPESTIGNIERIFATDNDIIGKCKEFVLTLNTIANLKDSEDNNEIQKEFCSYIAQMLHKSYCISEFRYRHIKLNDFTNVYNNDIETISRMINDRCKQNIQEDGYYHDVHALIDDVKYIYKKTNDKLLEKYIKFLTYGLLTGCHFPHIRDVIFRTNYVHYSVFVEDYNGNKRMYNKHVK